MPIYEYACSSCGAKFDALRSMKDADKPLDCAKCHSTTTRRVQSMCYSQSQGRSTSTASSGCAGCSGGSCGSCGH